MLGCARCFGRWWRRVRSVNTSGKSLDCRRSWRLAGGKGVVVAYAGADALTTAEWRRVLAVANQGALPLALVTIPASRSAAAGVDLAAVAGRVDGAKIPVISVDAGDAVALYRVMQETSIRARADGGLVVIECVRSGVDPVRLLAEQLKQKRICTESWIRKVEEQAATLGVA